MREIDFISLINSEFKILKVVYFKLNKNYTEITSEVIQRENVQIFRNTQFFQFCLESFAQLKVTRIIK